jgi:hypothetical protein
MNVLGRGKTRRHEGTKTRRNENMKTRGHDNTKFQPFSLSVFQPFGFSVLNLTNKGTKLNYFVPFVDDENALTFVAYSSG